MPQSRIESPALSVQGISHGFFTRVGGVSTGDYASLNCGYGSHDDCYNVKKNREIVVDLLSNVGAPLLTPYQHHSADVVVATEAWDHNSAPKGDAIVTQSDDLVIGILTADCAPVLFADPSSRTIAAAHAGWRGALAGILENTVEAMVAIGAHRRNIIASIGPSLHVENFEVGAEFYEEFCTRDEKFAAFFEINPHSGKHHFNLTEFAKARLISNGIASVDTSQFCTYSNESLFYSYRRNMHDSIDDYGRQISVIAIN